MRSFLGMLVVAPLCFTIGCGGASSATAPAAAPSTTIASAPSVTSAPASSSSATGLKAAGEAAIGDRTRCPTSGEEFVVTADSPKVEYKGKTYYFCCGGCDKKFASDPEKYIGKKPDA